MSRPRARGPLKKRLLASPWILWPLAVLASTLLRLIYLTNRKTFDFPESLAPFVRAQKNAIYCFWHGRMLAQPFISPALPTWALFSRHRDGRIISMVMRCFGIRTIAGSSSRGGASAILAMLKTTHHGSNLAITPDGPRGPNQQAAPGAVFLASRCGYPIIAATYAATRYRRLNSWDRFMMFLPFGRIHFIAAEPISIAPDADDAAIARATLQLQETLTRITAQADAACGVAP